MSSYEGSSVRSPSAATAGLLRSIFVATLLMSVAVTLAKTKKSEERGLLIDIFLANICLPERTSELYGTDITYLSHVMQLLSMYTTVHKFWDQSVKNIYKVSYAHRGFI